MDNVRTSDLVLQHWGIKGQKWGRRRYQNKDGSLTDAGRKRYSGSAEGDSKEPKLTRKQRKEQARKAEAEAKAREEAETVEQKRARLLKSSDASELYKNRDLLSTAEINERLNRIDTERRLAKAAEDAQPVKKTLLDKVDTALKYGKKINEVYEFTNTPVMKALKKKMGIEKGEEEKSFDIKKIYENRDKLSDKDVQNAASRAENYTKLKKLYDSSQTSKTNNTDSNVTNTSSTKTNNDASATNNTVQTSSKKPKYELKRSIPELTKFKAKTEDVAKVAEKASNTKITDAANEVRDAVRKVPKSPTLKKEAAKEIIKEVGPELDEVISTFNDAITSANQKKLDNYKKNNS